jgi:hypothetical protein
VAWGVLARGAWRVAPGVTCVTSGGPGKIRFRDTTLGGDPVPGRFISAVALYGPKSGLVRELLAGVQAMIAGHIGDRFRPYSLDQIHATLIALNAVPDPRTGTIVNEYFLTHQDRAVEMDLPRVMDILTTRFTAPLPVRIGGHQRHRPIPFTSRGQHLFDRTFSVQDNAFVLVGWPVVSLTATAGAGAGAGAGGAGQARPVDELRRELNGAGLLHRYHVHDTDIDNDLHLVVGHQAGAGAGAGARAVERAVEAVRSKLAAEPVDFAIGLDDVKIVAADSHTLAPPLYVSAIPADEATLRMLMLMRP